MKLVPQASALEVTVRKSKDAEDFLLKDRGTPPSRYTISICLSGVLAGRGRDSCQSKVILQECLLNSLPAP